MAATEQAERTAPNPARNSPLIIGHGEMADLIRRFDWNHSQLGAVEGWPESLRITVNTMLSCPHPMFLWWGPQLIQFYNDAYAEIIHDDKHPKALGQRGQECWPEIWPIIGPQIEDVMKGEAPVLRRNQLVPIYRRGKLEDIYWTYSYSPVFGHQGEIAGALVVCSVTTEEVLSEQRLRKSENRFRHLVEEATVGVVIGNPKGNLTYLNPAILRLLGYGAEAGTAVVRWDEMAPDAFSSHDRKCMGELVARGETPPYETACELRDGRKIPLLVSATSLANLDGSEPEMAVFLADLTALRRTEEALLQAEKLAAVGRLSSSIAHEINNPLESVTNLLHLIEHDIDGPDAPQYIRMAQEELARIANITRHTLRFHRQQTRPVEVTKAEILEEVLTLFRGRLRSNDINVETRFARARATRCYSGDLRQMFANFINNAVDASARGGRIFLREREGTDWKTGRLGIRVTVADRGHGMSKETMRHIFEPFYTTKENTGTGLGLWVSAGILKKHSAGVSIRSSVHPQRHGTVFAVWFPIEGAAAA